MSNSSRLLALQRAAFRESVRKSGGGFCRICQGRTKSPDLPFCFRHFRELPPSLRSRDNLVAAEAYLCTPRPLPACSGKGKRSTRCWREPAIHNILGTIPALYIQRL